MNSTEGHSLSAHVFHNNPYTKHTRYIQSLTFCTVLQRKMFFYRHYIHSPILGCIFPNTKCIFMKVIDKVMLTPRVKSLELWRKWATVENNSWQVLPALGTFRTIHFPFNNISSLLHIVNQSNIFLAAGWESLAALCWFKIITASKASANSHRRTPLFITEEQRKIMLPHYSSSNII